MASWQLQEAKNKFSEVVQKALDEGPQEVTRHGRSAVVVISEKEYKQLKQRKGSLRSFFAKSPLTDIDLERRKDHGREIVL